jgi:hypothetical protein
LVWLSRKSRPLSKPAKKHAKIFGQEFRFLGGSEVTSAWHIAPMLDVVAAFDPLTGRKK